MGFSVAPLLIHSEAVPARAREALRAATSGPAEQRDVALRSAAHILYSETELDCGEVRELVRSGQLVADRPSLVLDELPGDLFAGEQSGHRATVALASRSGRWI